MEKNIQKWKKFNPAKPEAFPFTTIVFDCMSSYGQYAITAIDEFNKNPDKRRYEPENFEMQKNDTGSYSDRAQPGKRWKHLL